MSRSFRKTPIAGRTTAPSDKPSKARAHRQERRAVRSTDLVEDDPPGEKAFGNPWAGEKDGKGWFDADAHPRMMRK